MPETPPRSVRERPAQPSVGDFWVEVAEGNTALLPKIWNGSGWVDCGRIVTGEPTDPVARAAAVALVIGALDRGMTLREVDSILRSNKETPDAPT